MAFSFQEEVSDGVQTVYAIDFDFRDTSSIYVYKGEHADYATQISWQFTNFNTQIELTNLSEVPAGTKFYIRRIVDRTNLTYIFENRSMRGKFVDEQNYAALYLQQELMDGFANLGATIPVPVNLDLMGNKITNVGDGVADTDAINLAQARLLAEAAAGAKVVLHSSQGFPSPLSFTIGTELKFKDTFKEYTLMPADDDSPMWVEDGNVGDEVDVTAASHLTLAQAQASDLRVGQYVRLTDFGNGLHRAVDVTDTGGDNYHPINATIKLRLVESGVLKISHFGVSRDITVDHSDQIEALIAARTGTRKYVDFEDYRLRFTRPLTFNEVWVKSSGAELLKDFDGTGVTVAGGSYYFRLRGDLRVTGYGAGFADGTTATTNGNANGIVISGCRLDIAGRFESTNHQGNGIFVNAVGNMNRSIIKALYASSNASYGIRFTGTQDDVSVWDISTYTTANYAGGVFVDDDFQGRQWVWFCYNEASNNPSGLYGVYIGRLRNCEDIQIYSEEQVLAGFEINIGPNCQNLKIVDFRNNRSNNDSVETCSLVSGNGGLWSQEGVAYTPPVRSTALTDSTDRTIIQQTYGSSNDLVREDITRGNGSAETRLNVRTNNISLDVGTTSSIGKFVKHYGVGFAQETTYTYSGTRDIVGDTPVGPVFRENHLCRPNGVDRTATTVTHNLDSVIGNRPVSSIVWAVSNNSLTPIDSLKLNSDGTLELLQIGVGIIARSPDGTRYRLTPPNGGGTATWVAA